jgi:triosephosphate isomerase
MDPRRIPLIAGNWKMHHGGASGIDLAVEVAKVARDLRGVEVVVAPPFTVLAAVAQSLEELAQQKGLFVGVAAQDLHYEEKGAFTGEVSAPMLVEAGCRWAIIGHSERRQYFGETDDLVAKKVKAALDHKIHPIVCIGESLEERTSGKTLDVVLRQLRAVMALLVAARGGAVIAYEPVWAIGTGKVATPKDAQDVHAAIRAELRKDGGEAIANASRILYGGSVKAENARDLLAQADIDGALVGGASLDVAQFGGILRAAAGLVGTGA